MEHCAYCGSPETGGGTIYATRITGQYVTACRGACADLLNAEITMWLALQRKTMSTPKVRKYVIETALASLSQDQLKRLSDHQGGMCLKPGWCTDDKKDRRPLWERDFDPLTIAFGVDRLRALWNKYGNECEGFGDIMGDEGHFNPKDHFSGHDVGYAFEQSTPEEIRAIARNLWEGR